MCTAISVSLNGHFFGRTLDYERSYGEGVAVTPRFFPLKWRHNEMLCEHYAVVGMATIRDGFPLYYDAMNEKGLCMAGLLFAGNAVYLPPKHGYDNVASFEMIPWVLSRCATVAQAKALLSTVRITDISFNAELPPTPLHWMVSDKEGSIVIEQTQEGVKIYDNPVGVLTNNPPFDYHLLHLTEFLQVRDTPPENRLYSSAPLQPYSRGMGAIGLPGDFSSASRFVRAAFVKHHLTPRRTKVDNIAQIFHALRTVEVPFGCVSLENGGKVYSLYTSCCDVDKGIYHYVGYYDPKFVSVDMFREDLTADNPVWYPFLTSNISVPNVCDGDVSKR